MLGGVLPEGTTQISENPEKAASVPFPAPYPTQALIEQLENTTGEAFAAGRVAYESFVAGANLEVQESPFFARLDDIHHALAQRSHAGNIKAIENWAGGEDGFNVVRKSWASTVDKLYRLNIEENPLKGPPAIPTIEDRAAKLNPNTGRWITPAVAHEVIDDLLRTKFVVPFLDGVVEIGKLITAAADELGLRSFRRFHAKDTGYHAQHHYVLLEVPGLAGGSTTIALEVKVLTKLQDVLGELTHALYEKQRVGDVKLAKKRKVAWEWDSIDFRAAYLGHSAHFLEATICDLKDAIAEIAKGG